jgi:sodium-dependent dicarboxylate transporter 2/3/5
MSPMEITLLLLLFAAVMFVWEKIPLALTSVIVCLSLVLTGVLDAKVAFNGFINTNVILFVAMFIVGGALFETGMANRIGGLVTRFAKTERQLIVAIMLIVGLLSGVLSNTGTAAVLIPVVIGIAAKSGFARSRLLMPLVFAAAMGGNLTLIGAPGNLIAQSALQPMGAEFGFFEYAKIGLPMLLCGIAYFALFGHRLLPAGNNSADPYDDTHSGKTDYSLVPKFNN